MPKASKEPAKKRTNVGALSLCLGTAATILFSLLTWSSPTPKRLLFSLIFMLLSLVYPVLCAADYAAVWIHAEGSWLILCRSLALLFLASGIAVWGRAWWPRPPLLTLQISPSGFPVSIPPHSVVSILRLHPNIVLSDAEDYLLKDTNDTGKEFFWPSQEEIDSKPPNDHEAVFRIEVANHSQQTVASGKLLFRLEYNSGSPGGGCMPPKGNPDSQKDFVLLPQLDPGRSFEFYAVNLSSSCVWLIAPDTADLEMVGDDSARAVALVKDRNPLYASGAPIFPPTIVKWEGIPKTPNGYRVQRIVH